MKQITFLIILLACFLTINGIYIRTKRQIEREDEETVVADKKVRESLGDEGDDEKDTEVMEVDVNEKDGSFNFGGHFPSIFNHGHMMPSSFQEFFNQMQQRFEEMARRMYDGFQNVSSNYPSNFNNTEEEIVTIDGKQYIKRRKILKKTGENTAVFITATSYEPINKEDDETNETLE